MDQFRGYTVAGMFVVNFLGELAAIHPVFKHNNTYFSYADSIMPSFMFACGFSYRLTALRRLAEAGRFATYRRIAARSAALVLVSLMLFGFNVTYSSWAKLTADGPRTFLAKLLKADLWEVLAIIGVTQVFLIPVIAARPWVRVAAILGCLIGHAGLTYSFNWNFVNGLPNWMDDYWGAAGSRCWDGGAFGILAWAVPMLFGTLTFDAMAAHPPGVAAGRLARWGLALMVVGYGLSCLTTLYNVPEGEATTRGELADSPVLPPFAAARSRPISSLLAEPPFVGPPPPSQRKHNYWMMGKRVVGPSFTLFASGFALALYAAFVVMCDVGGVRVGLFRTFGRNALAAYAIHHAAETSVRALVPADSPLWWCLVGLGVFFGVTYLMVKYLEDHGIFVRL